MAISIGASQMDASRAARISDETYRNWLNDGRRAQEALADGVKLSAAQKAKLQFLEDIEAAEAQCAIDMQAIIYNSAQRNSEDAKWWLERRRPDQFRTVTRNEAGGLDGKPMEIVIRYADPDAA